MFQFHLVLQNFTATKSDELSLKENQYVVVDSSQGLMKGWKKGVSYDTGAEGYFPENFAKKTADWRIWSKNLYVYSKYCSFPQLKFPNRFIKIEI